MKRSLFIAVCLLAFLAAGRAQCPDFTDLTGPGVACWADNDVPATSHAPIPGRYTVVTQQGMDPYTGYQLPLLPTGESAVIKLGNDLGGKQLEAVDYNFVVDPNYPVLTIKYAFVMQNFGNLSTQGPWFSIYLLQPNAENQYQSVSIWPCGVYAFNDLQLQEEVNVSGNVVWKSWTTLCVNLSGFVGQQIRVRFVTSDGIGSNSTFGYAYYTASCTSAHLSVVGCDGQNITLAAPEGYSQYWWNNGSTASTSTYPLQDNLDVQCHLVSNGCAPSFDIHSVEGLSFTTGESWYDTICEGEPYHGHGFDLPAQSVPGNFTFTRTVIDPGDCLSGVTHKLILTVRQRDVHHYATVCEGEDFDQYGFHYTNLQPGVYSDNHPLTSASGCTPAYEYLHLTVNPSLAISAQLTGAMDVCNNMVGTYTLDYPGQISQYQWTIPDGVTNFTSSPERNVSLYFTEDAPNPAVISVAGTNACGCDTLSITVWHHPSYHLLYDDTACTGETYNNFGFHTAQLDSAGLYFLSQHSTTVNGCDSDVMVRLIVSNTPELTTLAQPEEICAGENTIVLAVGDYGEIVPYIPLQVVPGDILCTDNSIVKLENFLSSGKTAMGVVFYVDTTGQHGWAVNLTNISTHCFWNGAWLDFGQENTIYPNPRTAVLDLSGASNSQVIMHNGWYIPSAGQLRILCAMQTVVNVSLQTIGGTPLFEYSLVWTTNVHSYWSSSLRDVAAIDVHSNAWFINSVGKLDYREVWGSLPNNGWPGMPGMRSIRDF